MSTNTVAVSPGLIAPESRPPIVQAPADGIVLAVTVPDSKTVHVTGGYTMVTASDGHRDVVTITREPADTLARLELHRVRADMLSLGGAPPRRLAEWLVPTAADAHAFRVDGEHAGTYTWRSTGHALNPHFEARLVALVHSDPTKAVAQLFAPESTKPIAVAGAPQLGTGATAHATLALTQRAIPILDAAVVSYLLLDRQRFPGRTLGTQLTEINGLSLPRLLDMRAQDPSGSTGNVFSR